jgi:hypothetical protein
MHRRPRESPPAVRFGMRINPPSQYADDGNFRARQRLWEHQDPYFDLVAWALDLAAVAPGKRLLDLGCTPTTSSCRSSTVGTVSRRTARTTRLWPDRRYGVQNLARPVPVLGDGGTRRHHVPHVGIEAGEDPVEVVAVVAVQRPSPSEALADRFGEVDVEAGGQRPFEAGTSKGGSGSAEPTVRTRRAATGRHTKEPGSPPGKPRVARAAFSPRGRRGRAGNRDAR